MVAFCFTLATLIQPRAAPWVKRGQNDSALKVMLGEGRRLFANHFFAQADVYFHSGYYPSIFDRVQAPKDTRHMRGQEEGSEAEAHEKQMDFMGKPRDLFERFGRNFQISDHTHLEAGNEREILPWLRISADLDPQRIDTYTVAAYWLRSRLGKVAEAEQFLREGVRNNPNSYELLFELGRLYHENYHDDVRARNVWLLALRRWQEQEPTKKEPDYLCLEEITVNLGRLAQAKGDAREAITYLQMACKVSPQRAVLQHDIDELKEKLTDDPGTNSVPKP
jgi:tetratricopeptide (TPR) repeat protein